VSADCVDLCPACKTDRTDGVCDYCSMLEGATEVAEQHRGHFGTDPLDWPAETIRRAWFLKAMREERWLVTDADWSTFAALCLDAVEAYARPLLRGAKVIGDDYRALVDALDTVDTMRAEMVTGVQREEPAMVEVSVEPIAEVA